MIDQDFIKQLSSKAASLFPVANAARDKLEADLHALLQRSLARAQLVTRDEFQSQLQVLERANEKIDELEARLARMEQPDNTAPLTPHTPRDEP